VVGKGSVTDQISDFALKTGKRFLTASMAEDRKPVLKRENKIGPLALQAQRHACEFHKTLIAY
jgi:hypothetical protein